MPAAFPQVLLVLGRKNCRAENKFIGIVRVKDANPAGGQTNWFGGTRG